MSIIEIARALYLKKKELLDKSVTKDSRDWADQCQINGVLSSGVFIEGIWEREIERAGTLCRYFWETAIDLSMKQAGILTSSDVDSIKSGAQEVIEVELERVKSITCNWIRKSRMPNQAHYDEKYEAAKKHLNDEFMREVSIRQGLASLSGRNRRASEPVTPTQSGFSWITDNDLRKICERDYAEVLTVHNVGAHKATIILSGSLTEALLLHALQTDESKAEASDKAPKKSLMQWDLHNLLEVAIELDLINPGAAALVKGIKDYRNLIHPGKEIRTKFHVGAEEAAISKQFLELVIRDLSRSQTTQ